jgi:AcrR family transcriptional regulator
MLIYHFGSREGLMVAVVQEVERRERETFMGTTLSIEGARRMWDRLTTPGLRSQERLFFEIYSHALLSRPGTEGFLDGVLDGWISPIVGSMVHVGIDAGEAQASARLGIAVTRGLLLDLLATGDRAGVTKAFDLFMRLLTETGFGQDNPDDGMPV